LENNIEIKVLVSQYTAMYKKRARATHRKLLKSNDYMPSLNTLSERNGKGGMWAPKYKKRKLKDERNYLFGMRFRG